MGGAARGGIQAFLQGLILQFNKMTAAMSPDTTDTTLADPSIWQESLGASERHRLLLEECVGHLNAFLAEIDRSAAAGRIDESESEDDMLGVMDQSRLCRERRYKEFMISNLSSITSLDSEPISQVASSSIMIESLMMYIDYIVNWIVSD